MLLRFAVGAHAFSGDIKQFFNCANLIPTHWNLQRFVYKEVLNVESETKDGVITTCIYGVTSSTCQTEAIKIKLSDKVKNAEIKEVKSTERDSLAKMLIDSTYVDDIGERKGSRSECDDLIAAADIAFASIGCKIKGWVKSGDDPPDSVSKNGMSIVVGGMIWFPK